MNERQLRKDAADLARKSRSFERFGQWGVKEWNDKVRLSYLGFMLRMRRFYKQHDVWED